MDRMKRFLTAIVLCSLFTLPVVGWSAADRDGWRDLSPREKDKIRQNYRRWENLPQQDKEHLREEWDRWQRLPQDRRERLKRRYEEQRDRRRD
jgi:hypothetical protein